MRGLCALIAAAVLILSGCAQKVPAGFDPARIADLSCRQRTAAAQPPRWIEPVQLVDQFRVSRWCATVGAVLFSPQPANVADRPVDRLVIVSWNIHEGAGDVEDLVRRLRRGEFTAGAPIDQLVLLLQEATRRDASVPRRIPRGAPAPGRIASAHPNRDADVRRLADDGLAMLYVPSMRNGGSTSGDDISGEDRGNAIVSTLPLQRVRLIELPLEHQRRVAAAASVEGRTSGGTPWRLDLVNVPLDTALALWHGGPFAARRRQAAALVEALDPGAATVLAGDLNTWGPREAAVRILSGAFPAAPPASRGPTWIGPLGLHASLDRIFVRGTASASPVTRLPSRFGSDHYPLLTIVAF